MFRHEQVLRELEREGHGDWSRQLRIACGQALDPTNNRDLLRWQEVYSKLPAVSPRKIDLSGDAVTVSGSLTDEQRDDLRSALMEFHPWRKGPFHLFDVQIDSEWRSNLKWERVAPYIDVLGKSVLDVGCGNGYYGWRMLDAGARRVIGLDPFLLYVMQHAVVAKYVGDLPNFVLPCSDEIIPMGVQAFDIVFSMGVLYHRASPIEHLQTLAGALCNGGQLVLETLVVDEPEFEVLVPEVRYAKMRNVWFIPSPPMLERWLRRTGFGDVRVVDITRTTSEEQRRTEWMQFESLADFLDPDDPSRTIEGYPSPARAIVVARRQ